MSNKKVLVTGGSGMIGNHIKQIQPEWIYISSTDCDLRDYASTRKLFEYYKPNYVIHLAANVGGLFKNINNQSDMLHDNLLINLNVIKLCHEIKVNRLVCCLSTCIFPDKINYPITENQIHDGQPHYSNYGYAYSKRMLDIMCKAYDLNYTCIIPCNIYGEFDNFNLDNGHVIPVLIHKAYNACISYHKLNVKGSGKALRQFIYAGDVAKLCINIIFDEYCPKRLILSPSEEVSINDIVKIIAERFDIDYVYEHTNVSDDDGQIKKTVSNEQLMKVYPNFQFLPIKNGINKTINWFIDNYSNAKR